MKKAIIILLVNFCFQETFSQEVIKENNEPEIKTKEIQKEQKLSANEKYAVKMLKSGYTIKSIMLQTKLTKKRIKELKKENL